MSWLNPFNWSSKKQESPKFTLSVSDEIVVDIPPEVKEDVPPAPPEVKNDDPLINYLKNNVPDFHKQITVKIHELLEQKKLKPYKDIDPKTCADVMNANNNKPCYAHYIPIQVPQVDTTILVTVRFTLDYNKKNPPTTWSGYRIISHVVTKPRPNRSQNSQQQSDEPEENQ